MQVISRLSISRYLKNIFKDYNEQLQETLVSASIQGEKFVHRILNKAIAGETEPIAYVLAFLSNTHFKMGNNEMSEYYRDIMLKRQSSGKANLDIPLAMVSLGRGKTEEALHFLKKAYKEKEYGFAWFLNIDPIFDEIKDNATFIELINKVGFDQ